MQWNPPLSSINVIVYKSVELINTATAQVDAIAKVRNREDIRSAFNGNTTATNRSSEIQTMLCTDTVTETAVKNTLSLHEAKPGVPLMGHPRELAEIAATLNGRDANGNIISETAMFTIKKFIVLLSSCRTRTTIMIRTFPTKLQIKIMEKKINWNICRKKESVDISQRSLLR